MDLECCLFVACVLLFCVLCFVFCVLCFVFCVLCFVFCILCFVFYLKESPCDVGSNLCECNMLRECVDVCLGL